MYCDLGWIIEQLTIPGSSSLEWGWEKPYPSQRVILRIINLDTCQGHERVPKERPQQARNGRLACVTDVIIILSSQLLWTMRLSGQWPVDNKDLPMHWDLQSLDQPLNATKLFPRNKHSCSLQNLFLIPWILKIIYSDEFWWFTWSLSQDSHFSTDLLRRFGENNFLGKGSRLISWSVLSLRFIKKIKMAKPKSLILC